MAITSTVTSQAKLGFLSGAFASGDAYYLALIKTGATGTYDQTFANFYSPQNIEEVANGSGYTTSGSLLSGIAYAITSNTASIDWGDATWPASTVSATGACLYKSSSTGNHPVISFYDFGGAYNSSGDTFKVTIPSAGTGVVRIF